MNRYFIIISLLSFSSLFAFSQSKTIHGYVSDAKTGERLIDVAVFDTISKIGTYTNEFGYYSLNLQNDSAVVCVSYIGYSDVYHHIVASSTSNINFSIEPSIILDEVIVKGKHNIIEKEGGSFTISTADVKVLPNLGGEQDFMKTIKMLPGFASGSDGKNGIFVRGGDDGQNLVLLDGTNLYNTSHLYGFLSVFNVNVISRLKIYNGGFPARYGGRLSSVIDIRTKDGNKNEYHGNLSVSPIATTIMTEGPIVNGKTSFMFSLRRTFLDLVSYPFIMLYSKSSTDEKFRATYYFYDINAKISHTLKNNDNISLAFYTGTDKLKIYQMLYDNISDNTTIHKWGNIAVHARWNHTYGEKLFSDFSMSYSRYMGRRFGNENIYYGNLDSIYESSGHDFRNVMQSTTAQFNFDWRISNKHYLRFGINYQNVIYHPGSTYIEGIINYLPIAEEYTIPSTMTNDGYLYMEDEMNYGKFEANIGLNGAMYFVKNKMYPSLQPRGSIKINVTDNFSFFASYTKMPQHVHSLIHNSMYFSMTLWLPSTEKISPMYARQAVLGTEYHFAKQFSISIEGYYKTMSNLIEYKDGGYSLEGRTDWENAVVVGSGRAYGVEFLARKSSGIVSGWISYTYSRSIRQFDELNRGDSFPFKYDRPNNLSVVITWNINDHINLSGTWVYYTGENYTMAAAQYPTMQSDGNMNYGAALEFSTQNNFRFPDYHRLDLCANFIKKKKHGSNIWSVGIYNVYNRQNTFSMFVSTDINGNQRLMQICLLPIIPFFSYEFKF